MKKILIALVSCLMAVTCMAFVACGESECKHNYNNGVCTLCGEADPNASLNNLPATDSTISDVSLKVSTTNTLYITSIGQAADYDTALALLTNTIGLESGTDFVADNKLTASNVSAGDTVIIVAGASDKGMGGAGVSAADEISRATAFANKEGINIVVLQLGGSARRGTTSDAIFEQVCPVAVVNLVLESANSDSAFTTWCANSNLYLYSRAAKMVDSLKFILGIE